MVAKVKYITEIGYFGPAQNLREVRTAPSLDAMVTCILNVPTPAQRKAVRAAKAARMNRVDVA